MEPITDPQNKRFCIFPIKYHTIYENHYQAQISAFWKPEEIDFSKDRDDYEQLTKDEQNAIDMILAFFASSDGIVNMNIEENLITKITVPEIRLTYTFQLMMENVHSLTYSMMIDNIIRDEKKKHKLFNAIEEIPVIQEISKWCIEYIHNDKPFGYKVLSFMLVEGLLFSGCFAIIFYLKDKHKNKLLGLTKSNEFIQRDETAHYNFGLEIYKMLHYKLDNDEVKDLITEVVDLAYKLVDQSMQVRLLGINNLLMRQYMESVADRISYDVIGLKIYHSDNPFSFMATIGLSYKSNFFEQRDTSYQSAYNLENDHDLELVNDF